MRVGGINVRPSMSNTGVPSTHVDVTDVQREAVDVLEPHGR